MKTNYFYNSALFRITAPVLFGMLTYLLVLMFFDSIDMLLENFFSREVLFTIGLTLLFFEVNRLIIVLNNKLFPDDRQLKTRIITQYISSFFATIFVVSITLYYYFVYVEGFSTIQTELITFNGIYLLISFFYNLFFFSLVFVNRKNESKVQQEEIRRQNLIMELESFKYQINPDFLFQSLEIIISELYRDKKSADDLINELSKTYRYTLDNKHNDLVSLKNELNSIKPVYQLFKTKYHKNLSLELDVDETINGLHLIPGTLNLILEFALSESIIADTMPLNMKIKGNTKNQLNIQYPLHPKLLSNKEVPIPLGKLLKAYRYYDTNVSETEYLKEANGIRIFTIPLLKIEEE